MKRRVANYNAHRVSVLRHDILDDRIESAACLAGWVEEFNDGYGRIRRSKDRGIGSDQRVGQFRVDGIGRGNRVGAAGIPGGTAETGDTERENGQDEAASFHSCASFSERADSSPITTKATSAIRGIGMPKTS